MTKKNEIPVYQEGLIEIRAFHSEDRTWIHTVLVDHYHQWASDAGMSETVDTLNGQYNTFRQHESKFPLLFEWVQ